MSLLTTLRAAFKGGAQGRVPLARNFVSPWQWAFERGGTRLPYEYRTAVRQAFLENPVAQRAVRIVADGIGGAPLAECDARARALVVATSAGQSLLETLAAQLLLHGNAFVQVAKDGAGKPVELYALRPERVSVIPDGDGWPAAYEYKIGDRKLSIPVEDEAGWPNLIHLKGFHPADDHYGAGCLSAAEQAVAIHNSAAAWNRALLDNAARPSGALVFAADDGGGLTTEQFERLKDELTRSYAGGANAGRPMVLEGGLTWQSMALSPAEMDFAELKASAARDIALAFGVPPMLLGLPGRYCSTKADGAGPGRPCCRVAEPLSMRKLEWRLPIWSRRSSRRGFSPQVDVNPRNGAGREGLLRQNLSAAVGNCRKVRMQGLRGSGRNMTSSTPRPVRAAPPRRRSRPCPGTAVGRGS